MKRLRHSWPLIGFLLAFLIGLAVGGLGGGAVVGALAALAFGSAYLVQNAIRRRRGTPLPQTPAEKARSDVRFLRFTAIQQLVIAAIAIAAAAAGGGRWLPGSGGTAWLLVIAAISIAGAPHTWALAERRAAQRSVRWAWALSGAFDLAFGLAAVAIAITNRQSHWLGGSLWTIGLAALGALLLLGAPGDLARARR